MKFLWHDGQGIIGVKDGFLIFFDLHCPTLGGHDYFPLDDDDGRASRFVNLGDELCAMHPHVCAGCFQQVIGLW